MNKKNLVIAFLLLVIAGCFIWLYDAQFKNPKLDLDIYQALGTVTAEEVAKLLGHKGEIVVVSWDFSQHPMPVVKAQLTSFSRALKKHSGVRIIATEKVERNPAQTVATGGAVPTEEFLKIVKTHPTAGAIVLFLAFPNLPAEDLKPIRGSTKFVVVSGFNPGYKKLLTDRTIDLAIVPRFDRTQNTRPPQNIQESFEQNYQVITPDQAATLPY